MKDVDFEMRQITIREGKGGRVVKSPLDSGGGTGQPPVARDVTTEYWTPFSRQA